MATRTTKRPKRLIVAIELPANGWAILNQEAAKRYISRSTLARSILMAGLINNK